MDNFVFEWDDAKAALNIKRHGVSFEAAQGVFYDPFAIVRQDRIEGGERRWQILGIADNAALLLLVAHTVRDGDEGEIVRIISARRAEPKERRSYYEHR
ncbi:membrane protein [Betaproteobacteria bacterium]|nr:membrane protein [Betaproteobacteria bacterium]GHU45248.1 membrane protein [Betaproteobacteria bacterium]